MADRDAPYLKWFPVKAQRWQVDHDLYRKATEWPGGKP